MGMEIYSHLNFTKFLRIRRQCQSNSPVIMQNDANEIVDMYIPRKCSATSNIIAAKDHGSVQIGVAELDSEGRHTGAYKYYAFCGKVRKNGQSDEALTNLAIQDGIISKDFNKTS